MDEAFARAALYAACEKSPILKQIKINNLQVSELRELININSSFQTRYLPILVSKFIIKTALQLGVNTFKKDYPTLCDYIKPENIKIVVESDEMACLELSTTANSLKKHNIIFTVTKNIVTGALGLSLDNLEKILNEVGTTAVESASSSAPVERLDNVESIDDADPFEKIEISNRKPVESDDIQVPIASPKIYSNTFSHTFVPETTSKESVIYESVVRGASDVSKTTSKSKRKFNDGSLVNDAKKMKQTDDGTALMDITDTDQSESRVRDYVNDTLNYAKNHNQEENDVDLDKMLPESNVYETESLLSITPSHSASQYNEDDGFETNGDTERQYERFDNDDNDGEEEFYDKLDDTEAEYLDDDPKSISSVELVTSKFKKTTNPDNFITNVEQFLSRVSTTNDKSSEIPVTVAEFDFD